MATFAGRRGFCSRRSIECRKLDDGPDDDGPDDDGPDDDGPDDGREFSLPNLASDVQPKRPPNCVGAVGAAAAVAAAVEGVAKAARLKVAELEATATPGRDWP